MASVSQQGSESDRNISTTTEISNMTAGEISDTDSTNTAIEFWDIRMVKFSVVTDEDKVVVPTKSGQSPIKWEFKLKKGTIFADYYPENGIMQLYGKAREYGCKWAIRAQVRVWASSMDKARTARIIDADLFDFGDDKKPIDFIFKYRYVTRMMFEMRYVFETYNETEMENLDNMISIQPSLTPKELLEKFYWGERYNLDNVRRANLLRIETSCQNLVNEMKLLPDYQKLSEALRTTIDKRLEDNWTTKIGRLGYFEATTNTIREIVFENGQLLGGSDPEAINESSLATTNGLNTEEILGEELPIEIVNIEVKNA